ncbi:MAG: Soluble lytic murein transglycosylase precursor [Syntrophus sp. PtaU1.Bin208]|nr:MAG: Soluble lytic murein transglycosylase precursor [Syntrophus sp. PtaU1.Bin208]
MKIVFFLCPVFLLLSSVPLLAEQPDHALRTEQKAAPGQTVLSTMTGSAADLYMFHDGDVPANYTPVSPSNRNLAAFKNFYSGNNATAFPRPGSAAVRNSDYNKAIKSACKRYTVDPALVRAVIMAESNFNPEAISPKGAMGLMQLMPDTARQMGVSNPFNPVENIHGGVGYLSRLLKSLNGDLSLALAAYNAGPERVKNYNGIPPFQETWSYIKRVLDYYQFFKGVK